MAARTEGYVSPVGKSGARARYSHSRRLFNEDGTPFNPFTAELPSPPRSPIAKMAPHAKGDDRDPVTGRKKLKTSDLPLTSVQRGAVEGLAHTFKKKGGYDSLRKSVWEDLEKSVGLFGIYDFEVIWLILGDRISKLRSRIISSKSRKRNSIRAQNSFSSSIAERLHYLLRVPLNVPGHTKMRRRKLTRCWTSIWRRLRRGLEG
jgi:COMPASS (Complex proteins associated with Set1p) component shg1